VTASAAPPDAVSLGLARAIEDGEFTPAQAVDLCADAIAKRESEVGAFVTFDIETGARPRRCRASRISRCGAAVALKDIFDTPTCRRIGSPIYAGNRPKADASLVALIAETAARCWARRHHRVRSSRSG